MKIDSDIVGAKIREYRTEVSWRRTTNYAAATGDMNPRYIDDSREGGITAPPMFAVAVTWPVVENIHRYVDIPYPPELFLTLVHYTEHIEFFSPVKPGDTLTVNGEVAALIPRKSGTQIIFKFEVTNQRGLPVFTEYMGGLLRGVECMDGGKGNEAIPAVPDWDTADFPVWEAVLPVGREAPYVYDGCTGIVFAIHTSPAFARAVGLPDIILQGTATLAYSVSQLVNREAGGDPARLEAVHCEFRGMVFPGSSIRVQLTSRNTSGGAVHLFFRALNEQGQSAISRGYARLKL